MRYFQKVLHAEVCLVYQGEPIRGVGRMVEHEAER